MEKEKKNRSGSVSNEENKPDLKQERKRSEQPGAPAKSNRQTGGNKRDDKDSVRGSDENKERLENNT